MKRFRSPLLRFLRLRRQEERLAELRVVRVRSELDAIEAQLVSARDAARQLTAAAADRLNRPVASIVVKQALLDLDAAEQIALTVKVQRQAAEQRLHEAIRAYREAQRALELMEKAVDRQLREFRREQARAAAVDLQDWALRPQQSAIGVMEEEHHA